MGSGTANIWATPCHLLAPKLRSLAQTSPPSSRPTAQVHKAELTSFLPKTCSSSSTAILRELHDALLNLLAGRWEKKPESSPAHIHYIWIAGEVLPSQCPPEMP